MSANELSALLWRERELLDLLEFKLTTEQLLLTAGNSKFLQRSSDEIQTVSQRLRELSVARDMAVSALAEEWELPEQQASLRQITEVAPDEIWKDIFNGHLVALVTVTGRIKSLRDSNELLLRAAARTSQETMANLGENVTTYDARGQAGGHTATAQLIDKDI